MLSNQEIVDLLPYQKPFHFVDELTSVDENGAAGHYTLKKDEFFYEGHFPGTPITPGVILIEIMAQVGLVCLGIYLGSKELSQEDGVAPVFSSSNVDFLNPVFPGDQVKVESEKIYYRFKKLKCKITCTNLTTNEVVCRGEFSGMVVNKKNLEK